MTYLKSLLFLTFCLLSPELFAGVFDVVTTDKSKGYLGIVFGGSVGAVTLGGGANPLLSSMFERFNFIVVTFGILILSYMGVVAAINTAREGEAMGKKFSLWVPLRGLFGMLVMLPSPGTGYSVIQMTVIWVVLNGIGAANAVWNVVLDQLAAGVSAVGQVDLAVNIQTDVNNLTESILQMSACKNVLNEIPNLNLTQNDGPVTANFPTIDQSLITAANTDTAGAPYTTASGTTVNAGDTTGYRPSAMITVGTSSQPAVCGSLTVVASSTIADSNFSAATALNNLQIKVNAVKAIFDAVASSAQTLSTPLPSAMTATSSPPSGLPGTFPAAYQNYLAQVIQLIPPPNPNNNNQNINTLKSFGWIHAGNYYYSMSKSSQVNFGNVTQVPTTFGVPAYNSGFDADNRQDDGFTLTLNNALDNVNNKTDLNKVLKRVADFAEKDMGSSPSLPSLGSDYPSTGSKFLNRILQGVLQSIRTPVLKFFSADLTKQSSDPLLSIGSFGTNLMLAGELAVFTLVTVSSLIMLAVSAGSCLSPVAWAMQTLFFMTVPGLTMILVLLWGMGATLGVYVPMVPYLIFTATAIGWMLLVIEALVGAPIIALGVVQPSGEELGQIKPALGILITIFFKPTLMIFGFVIAGGLLRAILSMINFGFLNGINTAIPYPTFFSIMPTLALYTFLIIGVVNQAFSLIYELPNKVFRYMGVSPEGHTPEKLMGETKSGFDKGAQAGSETLKGRAEKGLEKANAAKALGNKKRAELPKSNDGPA